MTSLGYKSTTMAGCIIQPITMDGMLEVLPVSLKIRKNASNCKSIVERGKSTRRTKKPATNEDPKCMVGGVAVPSAVLVSHLLPYLNRASFSNVTAVASEVIEATKSAKVQPPWPQTTLQVGKSEVRAIAFSPTNDILVGGFEDGEIMVWENKNGKRTILHGHEADVLTIEFARDGSYFATGSRDCTVRLWRVSLSTSSSQDDPIVTCVHTFEGHRYPVHSISVSPDGKVIASNGYEKVVRLWSVPQSRCIGTIKHKQEVESVAISPNGQSIATATWDGCIRLFEIPCLLLQHESDNDCTSNDDTSKIFVPEPMTIGRALPSTRLSFSNDGRYIYGLRGYRIRRWDLLSKTTNFDGSTTPERTVFTGHRNKRVICVAISPNISTSNRDNSDADPDMTVAYGEYDGGVRVAPLTRESMVKTPSTLLVGPSPIVAGEEHDEECALAFSSDGRTLASATVSGIISLWTI